MKDILKKLKRKWNGFKSTKKYDDIKENTRKYSTVTVGTVLLSGLMIPIAIITLIVVLAVTPFAIWKTLQDNM